MEDKYEITIKDFYQAVVLKSAGYPLIRIEKLTPKTAIFVFEDTDKQAQEIISKYWQRTLNLNIRDFVESIHELKTRLYSVI